MSRDAGFALSEGRDSGFQSNMGASFGIASMRGMQDAENIHQDYGIGQKFESSLQYGSTLLETSGTIKMFSRIVVCASRLPSSDVNGSPSHSSIASCDK